MSSYAAISANAVVCDVLGQLQSLAEWRVVLEAFTPRQRQLAAGLYNASAGCDLSDLGNEGLAMLLTFMTEPVLPGEPAVYLSGVFYRAALQVWHYGALQSPLGACVRSTV
jgi:hypothetical protein